MWQAANDLALDAALAAMVWHRALAPGAVHPSVSVLMVLGLSVWLVYLGDRWLDVRGKHPESLPTQRHRFVARRRTLLLTIWCVVLLLDVALAVVGLTLLQFGAGLILLILSIAYTIGTQHPRTRRYTKELQVALIFTGGVGAFYVGAPISFANGLWLVVNLFCFALICFLNCVLIARWEMNVDLALGRTSLPLALGERASVFGGMALLTGLVCFVLALIGLVFRQIPLPLLMLGFYAVCLWWMDHRAWPRNSEKRRCLADALLVMLGLLACL